MPRLLVALDASPRAAHVLAAAVELAERMNAKLVLFRAVVQPADASPDFAAIVPGHPTTPVQESAIAELHALAAHIPSGLVEDVLAEHGPPGPAICCCAERRNVDLVVVGAHGYRFVARVLGTTATYVADRCTRPVFVVRSDEDYPPEPVERRTTTAENLTVAAASGVVAGASMGLVAGPPGVAVGAFLGAAVGALAGVAMHSESATREERNRSLDEERGLYGGTMGAATEARTALNALEERRAQREREEMKEFDRSLGVPSSR
jgi:nucleotide-binding universal stress UspA family protein